MPHDECPMAIALKEARSVRGVRGRRRTTGRDAGRVRALSDGGLRRGVGNLAGAINVLVDVTERRRAEDALRAASTVKDEFLGLVSHELRTPVTTIFGNARLLQGVEGLPDRQVAMVGDIAADAERLLALVENLLLLTRAGSEQRIELEPQVLSHVVRHIVSSFQRRHPDREFRFDIEPPDLIVEADRGYLELLLDNLLSNAAKYSPPDEPIEVVVSRVGDEARVVVLDSRHRRRRRRGGLALHGLLPVRVGTSDDRRALGIGLSAAKHVVTILGGRILGVEAGTAAGRSSGSPCHFRRSG